jgi:hypothetical protein
MERPAPRLERNHAGKQFLHFAGETADTVVPDPARIVKNLNHYYSGAIVYL